MAFEKLFLGFTLLTKNISRDNIGVSNFVAIFKGQSGIHYPSEKGSDLDNLPVQFPHFIDKEIDPESLNETIKSQIYMVAQSGLEASSLALILDLPITMLILL